MRFKILLLTAVGAACLALPAASFAQDKPDEHKGGGQHPASKPAPTSTPKSQPQGGGQHPGGGGNQHTTVAHGPMTTQGGGQHTTVHPVGSGQNTVVHATGGVHTQHQGPAAGGSNMVTAHAPAGGGHSAGGRQTPPHQAVAVHTQQRSQWAQGRTQARSHAVWSSNRNWWRGNARFSGYNGARSGYYFAPGHGYYALPREYWGRSWGEGEYLPLFFLAYALSDYNDYGLPPAPYGCEWVWVGNNVLLVDMRDGYVLDEMRNVY